MLHIRNKSRDEVSIIMGKPRLCTYCEKIPFAACLPPSRPGLTNRRSTPDNDELVHILELRHILNMQKTCPCCNLLLRCVRTPENDLFKAEHIKNYLFNSEKLRNIKTFNDWADQSSRVQRLREGEEGWPFGYTRDGGEAALALIQARELFDSAEERDLHAGRIDELASSQDNATDALVFASLGMGLVAAVNPNIARSGGRAWESTRLLTDQMALMSKGSRKPLPCCFVLRGYPSDTEKAGAFSVRVFANGRAPRAPVKEVCHFSLRFEGSEEPRRSGTQLWYGRKLKETIDVSFFSTCLEICRKHHHDVCGNFKWSPRSPGLSAHQHFVFRFVDVWNRKVVETDFDAIIQAKESYPYVALSYVWGKLRQQEMHYVKLTRLNQRELTRDGALTEQNVPRTIWHAMRVVRDMDLQYLWVDRLCVLQQDGEGDVDPDTSANLCHMGRIYGEALLTIVAGSSQTMEQGLSGLDERRNTSSQIMGEIRAGIRLFLPKDLPQRLSPWEGRAWTYQEKILSRRMLVFSVGHAVWYCGCAVWREDVNALDGDLAALSFPWPRLEEVRHPNDSSESNRYGLQYNFNDGSVRLHRRAGFHQYVQFVEDFSRRQTRDPESILEACEGILSVLGSAEILNSPFLKGLPSRFMDVALLWQPNGAVRHRSAGNADRSCRASVWLPSWSWAGWEAGDTSIESKGGSMSYYSPFENIRINGSEISTDVLSIGEERIRPWAHIYSITDWPRKLIEVGLYGEGWLASSSDKFRDWEGQALPFIPTVPLDKLTTSHLVIRTEVASLKLGAVCWRVRSITKVGQKVHCQEWIERNEPPPNQRPGDDTASKITVRRERSVLDSHTSAEVGLVQCCAEDFSTVQLVKAMILSEAQYLGTETQIDVLGYPLYNILLIQDRPEGHAERIGLGKIYKTAWTRAEPKNKKKTVILG